MKKLFYLLPVLVLAIACTPKVSQTVAVDPPPPPTELMNFSDSVFYAIGANMFKDLNQMIPEEENFLNIEMLKKGMDEAAAGKNRLSEEDTRKLKLAFQGKIRELQLAKQEKTSIEKKKEATAFLTENATKEGVKTTASGLQYKVLKEGNGATPTAADQVEVHYEGRLIDGTVFDSSYERGETITFAVRGVISGWTEGLQLMKEGAKFQFYIPAKLAYGERGSPPKIGPGEMLIFDVELFKVIK